MSAPAETLLARLENVREIRPGQWLARCPAHQDKSPSLSVKETSDGVILINDFAGCSSHDVLASVGLEFKDLYPEPLNRREGYGPTKNRIPAKDLLRCITNEAFITALVASDVASGKAIDSETADRVATAAGRIAKALNAA